MTRDNHTDSRCERLRAVLCDRRVHALLLTLAVVAVLSTGLAVAQDDGTGGDVVYGTDMVFNYSAHDSEVWSVDAHDGRIVSIDDDELVAFDVDTRQEEWSISVPDPEFDWNVVNYGEMGLYVANGPEELARVDPSDGSIIWTREIIGSSTHSPNAIVTSSEHNMIVTGHATTTGEFAAFRPDGTEVWSESLGRRPYDMAVDGTDLYVGHPGRVGRYNLLDGSPRESRDMEDTIYGVEFYDETLYAATADGNISTLYPGNLSTIASEQMNDPSTLESGWLEQHRGGIYATITEQSPRVVDSETLETIHVFDDAGPVTGLAFSNDLVIFGADNGEVQAWGTRDLESNPQLEIDAPIWMEPGSSADYSVTYYPEWDDESRGPAVDVTDNATVISDNESILSVDGASGTITGSDDTFGIATLNTTHEGFEARANVTVSPMTAEYLEIIPGPYRFTATFNETGFQIILIAIMSGVVATRFSTAFGGIGATQLVLLIGWFAGFVSLGIALVGLFTAMFIGFNLAANVDYSVRR